MDDGENHPLPPKAPLPAGPTQGFESQDTLACARDSLGLGLSLCLSESLSHTPDPALSLSRALARSPSLSGSLTRVLAPELVPAVQAPARRLVSSALETQRGRLGIEGLRQPGGAAHRQARPATARKLVSVGLSWRHMDATVARNWTFDWLPRAAREPGEGANGYLCESGWVFCREPLRPARLRQEKASRPPFPEVCRGVPGATLSGACLVNWTNASGGYFQEDRPPV
ncbi:uncharacterized protein [Macaca fascicularis]|uniref:uncharacterized protein n=1 Tax=Macaca fascicularis TaxID=9541 RepID=UPI003D15387D